MTGSVIWHWVLRIWVIEAWVVAILWLWIYNYDWGSDWPVTDGSRAGSE